MTSRIFKAQIANRIPVFSLLHVLSCHNPASADASTATPGNSKDIRWTWRAVTAGAVVLAALALASSSASAAVSAGLTAMRSDPCAPYRVMPPNPASPRMLLIVGATFRLTPQTPAQQALARRAAARQRQQDWADLCHYRAANAALRESPQAVFMGDSITQLWRDGDPSLFGSRVVDRGISGQTSAQMLVRFWSDVIALHPRIVQILAGTNDIAGNTGPTTERAYEDNIRAMVDLAQAHHIRVILGAIPPAEQFWWAPRYRPAAEIRRLNGWLRRYARYRCTRLVDYYAALATANGAFRRSLSNDGVHPNAAGFKVMSELARAALAAPWRAQMKCKRCPRTATCTGS